MGALGEKDLAFELLTRLIAHDVLPVPSKSAGLRGTWRKLRDRREPSLTSIAGGWRGGCADLRSPADLLGTGRRCIHCANEEPPHNLALLMELLLVLIIQMEFWQHAHVQDTGDDNAVLFDSIEEDVFPLFHAPIGWTQGFT